MWRTLLLVYGILFFHIALSQMNGREHFFVGNIDNEVPVKTDFIDLWDQLTPENGGKWGAVEKQEGVYDFNRLDAYYAYTRDYHIPFKYHTLVWGTQQPAWLDTLNKEEQQSAVLHFFDTLAQRYPDIEMLDVVNEALHDPPPFKEAIGGDNDLYGSGWDWVVWSFQQARIRFPNAILLLNDYDVLKRDQVVEDYYDLVLLLQDSGLIDGIGCQGHFLEDTPVEDVHRRLTFLAQTGLPIYVSEFDLNLFDDSTHLQRFRQLFSLFYGHQSVRGITFWGYQEGKTWREHGYMKRVDGSERPSLVWLRNFLDAQNGHQRALEFEKLGAKNGGTLLGDTLLVGLSDGDWFSIMDVPIDSSLRYLSAFVSNQGASGRIIVSQNSLEEEPLAILHVVPNGSIGFQLQLVDTLQTISLGDTVDLFFALEGDLRSVAIRNLVLSSGDKNSDLSSLPFEDEKNGAQMDALIRLYPNPASEYVFVTNFPPGITQVELLQWDGSVLKQWTVDQHKLTVPLFKYSPGFYLLRFTNQQLPVQHKLLVKH